MNNVVQLTGIDPLYLEVFSPMPIQDLSGLDYLLEVQRIAEAHLATVMAGQAKEQATQEEEVK